MSLVYFIFFIQLNIAQAFDVGIVNIVDQLTLSKAQSCVLVDKQVCVLPVELICDGTTVAQVNVCSESLNIFRKAKQVDFAYVAIYQFMAEQGFKVDQTYKYVLSPLTRISFLTFVRNN